MCGERVCGSARDDIALVVEADIDLLAVLHRLAAPNAVVVLGEPADIREAILLDSGLRFAFGEAVAAFNRCFDLLRGRAADSGILRSAGGRRVLALSLGQSAARDQRDNGTQNKRITHAYLVQIRGIRSKGEILHEVPGT